MNSVCKCLCGCFDDEQCAGSHHLKNRSLVVDCSLFGSRRAPCSPESPQGALSPLCRHQAAVHAVQASDLHRRFLATCPVVPDPAFWGSFQTFSFGSPGDQRCRARYQPPCTGQTSQRTTCSPAGTPSTRLVPLRHPWYYAKHKRHHWFSKARRFPWPSGLLGYPGRNLRACAESQLFSLWRLHLFGKHVRPRAWTHA